MKTKSCICLLLGVVLLVNQSCSQNKKVMDDQAKEILGNLYKDVKYKDKAVNYHAEIQIGGCGFEVFVNDMPVYKYAGDDGSGSIGTSAPINMNILKSGEQTWEVRVFPPEQHGKRLTALPEGVKVELSVEALKFRSDGVDQLAEPVKLIVTPKKEKDGKQVYADAGKPFMVYKGTFKATVPYELTGWSKSADLSKEDSSALKNELVTAYQSQRRWLEEGDLNKLANAHLNREKDRAQATYYDKALNDDYLATFMKNMGTPNMKMYPLENYKMVFSGNGKMITLERTDRLYVPALLGKRTVSANGKDKTTYMTYYLNFHRPKPGAALEVIR